MNYKQIGNLIRKNRKIKRMSQIDLAKKSGISRRTIIKAESGDPKTTNSTYNDIAKTLNIKFDLSFPIK